MARTLVVLCLVACKDPPPKQAPPVSVEQPVPFEQPADTGTSPLEAPDQSATVRAGMAAAVREMIARTKERLDEMTARFEADAKTLDAEFARVKNATTKAQYDAAMARLEERKAELARAKAEIAETRKALDELQRKLPFDPHHQR